VSYSLFLSVCTTTNLTLGTTFGGQAITFKDIGLEKLYIFIRFLNKKLPKRDREKLTDIVSSVNLEYFRIEQKSEGQIYLNKMDGELTPLSDNGSKGVEDEPMDYLSNIIQILNESYGSEFTDEDKVNVEKLIDGLSQNEELKQVYSNDNTDSNRKYVFERVFDSLLQGLVDDSLDFYKKISEPRRNRYLKDRLFDNYKKDV